MHRYLTAFALLLALPTLAQAQAAPEVDESDDVEVEAQEAANREKKTIRGRSSANQNSPNRNRNNRNRGGANRGGPQYTGPFKKAEYPLEERTRPLVLPDGMGEVGIGFDFVTVAGSTSVGTGLGLNFGIGDSVELGVATGFLISPDVAWGETVLLSANFLAVDGKEFDWAPGISLPIVTTEGAGFSFALDLPARAVMGEQVFLFFGNNAIPIRVSPDFSLGLAGNGGIGVQFRKDTALLVGTNVFVATIVPDATVSGIWEVFTLSGTLQYTPSRTFDVGLTLNVANTWDVADTLVVGVSAYGAFRF